MDYASPTDTGKQLLNYGLVLVESIAQEVIQMVSTDLTKLM